MIRTVANRVSSSVRAYGPWLLAMACFVALTVRDPGLFGPAIPGDDVARDFSWVYQMFDTGIPVLHGGDSSFGPGQPSPVYLWLLAIGSVFGGYTGAYLFILAIYIILVAAAGRIAIRATGSAFAGYGLLLALVQQDKVNLTGIQEHGSTPTWFTVILVSNALLLVAIFAAVATPHRWIWSGPVTMVTSFTAMAIWGGAGTIGSFLLLHGFWSYLRHRKKLSFRHHVVALGIPFAIGSLIVVRVAMAHAEILEGFRFSAQLWSAQRDGSAFAKTWVTGLGNVTFGTSYATSMTIWLAMLVLTAVFALRKVRGAGVFVLLVVWAVAFGIFLLPSGEPHMLSTFSLIPMAGVSLAFGVLGKRFLERTYKSVDRPALDQARKAVAIVLATIIVTSSILTLTLSSGENAGWDHQRKSRYELSLSFRPTVLTFISELEKNAQVRQAYENDDLLAYIDDRERGFLWVLAPAVDQFHIAGHRICYVREGNSPSELFARTPATSLHCRPDDERNYALMFASTAKAGGFEPLATFKTPFVPGFDDAFAEIVLVKVRLSVDTSNGLKAVRPAS